MVKKNIIEKSTAKLIELLLQENILVNKIILFGSYANGVNTKESDIDLIVVSPIFRDMGYLERIRKTMYIDSKMVREFQKPFDILYYSDLEWEGDSSIPINEAKKYGKILYSIS